MGIENNFSRKKRSAGNRARQSDGTVAGTHLYTGNNNMVADVVINLKDLLGTDTFENYYYYEGSMTVPGCNENTKWIISTNMLKVSAAQLTTLRGLQTNSANKDMLQDNFRPVQSLNSRSVFKRSKPAFVIDTQQAAIFGSSLATLGAFPVAMQVANQLPGIINQLPLFGIAKSFRENPITDFVEDLIAQGQQVVQQRSSSSEEVQYQHHHQYQQPVYQPQHYQQYVPALVPPPQ